MTRPARTRGFTLIELLAAMAVLAAVALMGVQLLSSATRHQRLLAETDDRTAALALTLALLRQDLGNAVPLALDDEGTLYAVAGDRLEWTRGGLLSGDGSLAPGATARVEWRILDGQTLTRRLILPQGAAEAPATALLPGVTALSLVPLGTVQPGDLPPGFRVTLTHARLGALDIVVAR